MRIGKLAAVFLLLISVVGCSGEPAPVSVAPPTVSPAKTVLNELATTGEMGSGMMEVQNAIEAMKKTDAAKAEKLDKELQALQSERDPAQVKAKAKALADRF